MLVRTGWMIAALAAGLTAAAPLAALSTAQQELAQVRRSRPDLVRGGELYGACLSCHGPSGGGKPDGLVPRIGGQHASVLAKQLVDYRHDRRWDLRMENFSGLHHLPDAQAIADVTAYISALVPDTPNGQGDGQALARGAAAYTAQCASCHGPRGEGDAKRAIPRLAGQHYEYLRRQIYDAVDGRRPNFSPQHVRLLARLDHEDIQAISDCLSRLGHAPR
jgi:cytochrome c553